MNSCCTCSHGNHTGDKACETCKGSNYEEDRFQAEYYKNLEYCQRKSKLGSLYGSTNKEDTDND